MSNNLLKKSNKLPFTYAIIIFGLSYVFSLYYLGGDQVHYHEFYSNVRNYSFIQSYLWYYPSTLGTREPGYFLLAYFFSSLVGKNILMSFFNALLAFIFVKWCHEVHVKGTYVFLSLACFYSWVLFLAAERLKFAVLFLLISHMVKNAWSFFWMAGALFFHAQLLPFFVSKVLLKCCNLVRIKHTIIFIQRKAFMIILFFVVLSIFVVYYLGDHICAKFLFYDSLYALNFDYLKVVLLALLALFVANDKVEALFYLIPILLAGLFVGSMRVTILAFFVFAGYSLQSQNKLKRSLLLFALMYYTANTAVFLDNVVQLGDGFSRSPAFFSRIIGIF